MSPWWYHRRQLAPHVPNGLVDALRGTKSPDWNGMQHDDRRSAQAELNSRQLDVLHYALRHPEAEFSTRSHQRAQGLDSKTARADLLLLESRGFLVKRQIGRSFVFYPAEDLDRRIGGLA